MEAKERVYIEFVPEHYTHEVAITIRCKKSEFKDFKSWFETFKKQRELDLDVINKIISLTIKNGGE